MPKRRFFFVCLCVVTGASASIALCLPDTRELSASQADNVRGGSVCSEVFSSAYNWAINGGAWVYRIRVGERIVYHCRIQYDTHAEWQCQNAGTGWLQTAENIGYGKCTSPPPGTAQNQPWTGWGWSDVAPVSYSLAVPYDPFP